MAYSILDDIMGEVSADVLLQLVNDADTAITIAMLQAAMAGTGPADVSDDEAAATLAAARVVTNCLARASAEVDGYCSNLYNVPFPAPPPFIKSLDLDLAVYNLFSRRENVPENRKDRRANTVKVLMKIGSGDIQLGVSGDAAPPQLGQTIAVTGPDAVFTRDRLRNY